MKTKIIAHRGGKWAGIRENTLEAFEKAIEIGVTMAELDVRKTGDGKLVCYHDESIEGKDLQTICFDELLTLSSLQGFRVALFEEVLIHCKGRIQLDIEIKEEGYEDEILCLVKTYLEYSEYVIKSFNDSTISKIKQIDPFITAGLLLEGEDEYFDKFSCARKFIEVFPEFRIIRSKADFVSPHFNLLMFGFTFRMRFFGREIYVWTANEAKLIESLLKLGVRAIITDNPELVISIQKKLNLLP